MFFFVWFFFLCAQRINATLVVPLKVDCPKIQKMGGLKKKGEPPDAPESVTIFIGRLIMTVDERQSCALNMATFFVSFGPPVFLFLFFKYQSEFCVCRMSQSSGSKSCLCPLRSELFRNILEKPRVSLLLKQDWKLQKTTSLLVGSYRNRPQENKACNKGTRKRTRHEIP